MQNLPENVISNLMINLDSEDVDDFRSSSKNLKEVVEKIESNKYSWKNKFDERLGMELEDEYSAEELKILFNSIIKYNPTEIIKLDNIGLFELYIEKTGQDPVKNLWRMVRFDALKLLKYYELLLLNLSIEEKKELYKISILYSRNIKTERYLRSLYHYGNMTISVALNQFSLSYLGPRPEVFILGSPVEKIIREHPEFASMAGVFIKKIVEAMNYKTQSEIVFQEIDFLAKHMPNLSRYLEERVKQQLKDNPKAGEYIAEKFRIR